jgi:hypothetical protein
MHDVSADWTHLLDLAAKCRRVAANLTDKSDVASLRQMASEYEAMAVRIERRTIPKPQFPTRLPIGNRR